MWVLLGGFDEGSVLLPFLWCVLLCMTSIVILSFPFPPVPRPLTFFSLFMAERRNGGGSGGLDACGRGCNNGAPVHSVRFVSHHPSVLSRSCDGVFHVEVPFFVLLFVFTGL